jgi:hypothetical protein
MTGELDELARGLDVVVRSVPGVHSVFSVAPQALRSARELTSGPVALTEVTTDDHGVAITSSVGVSAGGQARSTARAVSEAIRDAIASGPAAGALVHVRVSRVAG